MELNKEFELNYDKRLQVLDKDDKWVDTLPITIKPGAKISQSIKKQQTDLYDRIHSLVSFTGTINQVAICDASYKSFDGYFLNYTLP